MKNTIENIHANINTFNGALYFKINNRLLVLSIGTPNFNDFGEWRISDISFSRKEYIPEENEVELTPMKSFNPITISEIEFEFLDTFFTHETLDTDEELEAYKKRIDSFLEKHKDAVDPFDYTDEPFLASYCENNEIIHQINKNIGHEDCGMPIIELDYETNNEKWEDKKSLLENQGLYNLLIPIMEQLIKEFK